LAVSGVLPDRDLARRWYERARELGSRDAEERLARLRGHDFYEGKTVNIVINIGGGGSTEVMAQLLSPYWREYIPGNPKFVVTPVVGDDMLSGITHVRNSRPDGLTLGLVAWSAATRQIGPASQRVDWNQFEVIAGLGSQAVAYMRSDVPPGITKPEDVLKAERLQIAGYQPGSQFDLLARMSLDILGVRHGYTTGLGGGTKIIAALQRNEVNFSAAPVSAYFANVEPNVVKEGIGLPLWYYAFTDENGELVNDPAFGDIRPFHEVVESATGKPPSGPLWETLKWLNDTNGGVTWLVATPRGVAEEKLAVLRDAFFKAAEDPQFLEQTKHVARLAPPVTSTQGMNRIIGRVRKVDPQIVSILQNYIKSGSK
jgi:hypothetical protein